MMTTTETLHQLFLECSGLCTDTRNIVPNSLFVALKGPNFDANDLAAEALRNGSRYAVVDDPAVVKDDRFLIVADCLEALQMLGRYHRRQFDIPVIAITGTNGKTTTKELVYEVLQSDCPTLATTGNLNNHIGVPLTLLRLNAEHRIAIIEMGANKPGDIAELCAIAEPTHGLITNIGKAHLEGFGSYEGVVRTKTELYSDLKKRGGTFFVNADDPLLMEESAGCKRVTYGTSADADTSGNATGTGPFLEVVFTGRGIVHHVRTKLIGGYNLPNALVAVAIGQYFDVPDDRIAEALTSYTPTNNRSQFSDTGMNHVVLDAYNANPSSMKAALENFAAMASDRPKMVILGDMRELGTDSDREHQAIVDLVNELGLQARYVGKEFAKASAAAYNSPEELNSVLSARPIQGHLILVKGSRGIRLETLVPAL